MKKISSLCLFLCSSLFIIAQADSSGRNRPSRSAAPLIKISKEPRFSINIHGGYSVGLGSTFKFYPDDVSRIMVTQRGTDNAVKQVEYSNPTKGLGDGFKFGFGGSYIVNDFINIGLDFDYFSSTIRKNRDSSIRQTGLMVVNNSADEYQYTERNTISYAATLLSLTPNITFKAISRPKWFLYNKIGMVITFRPNSLQEDRTDINIRQGWQGFYRDSSSTVIKKYEWGIKNPALGFMGAFGGQIKVANNIRAFAEVNFSHVVFVIRKRTLTDFMVDNKDIASTLPRSMREIEFVKSFSSSSISNNPDRPAQTIIQRIPITYVGLQAGLSFQLK
jgi:hypothetical protein